MWSTKLSTVKKIPDKLEFLKQLEVTYTLFDEALNMLSESPKKG